MAGFGFAFVAHGYLEPSRRVPGERERYPTWPQVAAKPELLFFFQFDASAVREAVPREHRAARTGRWYQNESSQATNGLDHFGPGRQAALLRQPVAARARAAADGRRHRVRVAKSAGLRGLPRALHGRGRRRGRARGRGRRARRARRRGRGAEPVRARRDAGRAGDGAGVGRRPSRVRRLPPAGSAARRRRRGDGNPIRGRRRARPRDFDRDPGRPRPPRRHGGARRGAILDPGRRLAAAERLRRRRGRGRGGGGRDRRERRRPGPRRSRPHRRLVQRAGDGAALAAAARRGAVAGHLVLPRCASRGRGRGRRAAPLRVGPRRRLRAAFRAAAARALGRGAPPGRLRPARARRGRPAQRPGREPDQRRRRDARRRAARRRRRGRRRRSVRRGRDRRRRATAPRPGRRAAPPAGRSDAAAAVFPGARARGTRAGARAGARAVGLQRPARAPAAAAPAAGGAAARRALA